MAKLTGALLSEENFPHLITDCKRLIEVQVTKKRGISGLAIKGGFKAVKKFRPDVIESTLRSLLPEFVERLDPFFDEYEGQTKPESMRAFVSRNRQRVANSLLGITDERARNTKFKVLRSAYNKLRPFAQDSVEEALPDVGDVVSKYRP